MRYPIFDFYRALAVSLVVFGHFASASQDLALFAKIFIDAVAGYGVPLFFIISGFLLAQSFESIVKKKYSISVTSRIFLIRRIFRIYPAYVVSLILLSLYYDSNLLDFVVHLFNVHNLFDDYNRSINAVYWTLAVEFQWYIIAPIAIFLFLRSSVIGSVALFLVFVWLSIHFRLEALNDYFSQLIDFNQFVRLAQDQFYIHLFNFFIGILVYRYSQHVIDVKAKTKIIIVSILILLGYLKSGIVWDLEAYRENAVFYKILLDYVSILVLGFATYAFMLTQPAWRCPKVVSFISLISYSLYIYHYPILLYLSQYNYDWHIYLSLYLSISILFATLSYYLVEAPFMKYSSQYSQHKH